MADSELGELRRPNRTVDHRLERLSRWRAQGLAGGMSDSVFPTDALDDVLASDGGGEGEGGALPLWFADSFALTSGSATAFTTTYLPLPYSEVVRLNGITLDPLTEYTISEQTVTLTDPTDLRLGIGADTWSLVVSYAYIETATNELADVYMQNLDAVAGGSSTVSVDVFDDDVALVFCLGTTTAVSGVYASWEMIYQASGGTAWLNTQVWKGTGVGTGSGGSISITTDGSEPSFANGLVLAIIRDAADLPFEIRYSDSDYTASVPDPGSVTVETASAIGDLVILAARSRNNSTTANFIEDPSLWSTTDLTVLDTQRSHVGATYGNGIGVLIGTATSATPSAIAEVANGGGQYVDFGISVATS